MTMNEKEEEEIIALLGSEQKKEALSLMIKTYSSMLYAHVIRMTQNTEDTKDVLQNAYVKAWKYLDSFENKSTVGTWLYKIASNEAITFLNKKKNLLKLKGEVAYPVISNVRQYSASEIKILLQQGLDTLPPKQKQVFIMRYYDALPYKEMSKLLDSSESSLKTNYHIAVKKIETFIKSH